MKKVIYLLFLSTVFFCILYCQQDNSQEETNITTESFDEILIPQGFQSLEFGMSIDEVSKELEKYSIQIAESDNDGWEVINFIQNTTDNDVLLQKLSLFIFSDRFTPEDPITNYLSDIKVYKLSIPTDVSFGIMTEKWLPVDVYFYGGELFGISAGFFDSIDSENEYKESIIEMYKNGRKNESDSFNTIITDDRTYFKINVADNLYIYNKKIYISVIAYINMQFSTINF